MSALRRDPTGHERQRAVVRNAPRKARAAVHHALLPRKQIPPIRPAHPHPVDRDRDEDTRHQPAETAAARSTGSASVQETNPGGGLPRAHFRRGVRPAEHRRDDRRGGRHRWHHRWPGARVSSPADPQDEVAQRFICATLERQPRGTPAALAGAHPFDLVPSGGVHTCRTVMSLRGRVPVLSP